MKLQKEQQEFLAHHIAQKPIEYIELYNELYDHYASAYENSEGTFEQTLEQLDEHFHYQRVKRINGSLLKKTKKSVNDIYWREFKNFWRWPQILSTLGILILVTSVIGFMTIKSVIWTIIIPLMCFNILLMIYGPAMSYFNKVLKKRFKSAHFTATQHYLNLPISIFNLSVFIPILPLDDTASTTILFDSYPILLVALALLFFISSYIGFKVTRTKIKVQYI